MKDPLIKGHPIHALLSDLPIGTTVATVVCDLLGGMTHHAGWRFAARAVLGMGLMSGALAALVGWWDYQAVPQEHPARRIGAWHGWLNASALVLLLASFLGRGPRTGGATPRMQVRGPEYLAPLFSLSALLVLTISGWLGGELVFRLGWRVTPAEHAEQLEADLHQQGEDERIAQAHQRVQDYEQGHALLP